MLCKHDVVGSIPSTSTKNSGCIVSLVDGRLGKAEDAGSNPVTPTNFAGHPVRCLVSKACMPPCEVIE